jgi:hypothetical protein
MMTEGQVNEAVRVWLEHQGYSYKGVLNSKPTGKADPNGYGQVPVPDGSIPPAVLIDHQGVKDREHEIIWVEAKGENCGMSDLLQGFVRVAYACYHGAGSGLLAAPTGQARRMMGQRAFLERVAASCERRLGVLDAEEKEVCWLC